MSGVPHDFPVQPIDPADPSALEPATCGVCGRTWDDGVSTSWTPVPSGRCPFEYFHGPELEAVYYVPRSQVWAGSRGRASGRVHLHRDGRALCGRRRGWYERPPYPGEVRCGRCEARAARLELAWPEGEGA